LCQFFTDCVVAEKLPVLRPSYGFETALSDALCVFVTQSFALGIGLAAPAVGLVLYQPVHASLAFGPE
jgi:hypothetical protein